MATQSAMYKLVVNPGTPQAWEIQLKPGVSSIGRNPANNFQINDPSVSGSHCQIVLDDNRAVIKDLGSTNGTFVNGASVQEIELQPGQQVQLGCVAMLFEGGPLPPAAPARVAIRVPALKLSSAAAPPSSSSVLPATEAGATEVEEPPVPPPLPDSSPTPLSVGAVFCKFHIRSPARFYCRKCQKYFCELCVASRPGTGKKTCRACGSECAPVEAHFSRPVQRVFFGRLPGVFVYPFRGTGLLVLIAGGLIFAGLGIMGGLWGILIKMVALGYLFTYMQNIIHSTAAEDNQMPELPGFDELFGACFRLVGTVLLSFGLAIGLEAALYFQVEVPTAAIIIAIIFGCLYFPMAFLAVAMKDNVMAGNPLVVVPSILKVPLEYIIAVILLVSIFGIQQVGDIIASGAKTATFFTRDTTVFFVAIGIRATWNFINVYLLTVNSRILGLLYLTNKDKFGWFSH
jgi:hypothetical protein